MSIILSDVLIYLHRGVFTDTWKQTVFKLFSNGVLTKEIKGQIRRSIDLKKVFKSIRIKSALDYVLKKGNNSNNTNNNNNNYYSNNNNLTNTRSLEQVSSNSNSITNTRCLFNRSDLFKSNIKFDLTDAMLMSIPVKAGSKKYLTLLFEKFEKLNEWLRSIYKWASIPQIKIEYISLKDQSVNHSSAQNLTNLENFWPDNMNQIANDKDKVKESFNTCIEDSIYKSTVSFT